MYKISRVDSVRMIQCPIRDLTKYKFYGKGRKTIKWDKSLSDKSNVRVILHEEVQVFGKPNPSHFHYEFMRNSRLQLNGWGGVDHDTLLENMLELLEKV